MSALTYPAIYRRALRAAVVAVLLVAATLITTLTAASALAQPATTPPPIPLVVPSGPPTPTPTPGPVPAPRWQPVPPAPTTPGAPVPVTPTPEYPLDPEYPVDPGTGIPDGSSGDGQGGGCGVTNISGCVADAVDGVFQRLVDSGLNPLLDLLSRTLLTTPEPGELPRVGELWSSSWQLVLAMYGLLVMVAGILLMVRETLQDRWSLRDLLPRLVVGFVAGAMSLLIATQAIRFANALAYALAGDGVDPGSAAAAIRELAFTGPGSGFFLLLLRVALEVMVLLLLIAYVIRVAITVILVVAAPLALMCHALPGLDAVARWWWRAFAACLAIQVVQSLVLVTSLRVFLTPGGWNFFGPNADGIVGLIIGLALMGVLVKTPFWLLSAMKIGQGRSLAGSIVRGYITYKTLGLLKGKTSTASARATAAATRPKRGVARPPKLRAADDPYARVRATRDGQLMLPLEGVHRVKRQPPPAGQPSAATQPKPATRRAARGRQLAFDFSPPDPYRGIRPGRGGQYPLPIPVTRVRPAPAPPEPVTAKRTPTRGSRGTQLAFDFDIPAARDPYGRVRPLRNGQYPLPIPVRRVRPAPPAPVPPQPPGPKRSAGRQLHLPLPDLPVRRRAPRTPGGGQS
ncbi:hypothetical protein [Nocardia wallacei]|uniref:hypothetical protein n=1 Tax=Nocardia wallacei TaxID=480035 RepID=UPI002455A732|nr:hypothetical protein [Nocardia wallacei]